MAEEHTMLYGSAEDYLDGDPEDLPRFDEAALRAGMTALGAEATEDGYWWSTPTVAWEAWVAREDDGGISSVGGDLHVESDYAWTHLETVLRGMASLASGLGARLWVIAGDPDECRELDEDGLRDWLAVWARG